MYFITDKNTATGVKFQKVVEKRVIAFEEVKAFAEKYNIDQWRRERHCVWGGMSSCIFKETPDPKVWGKGSKNGEYFPKKSSKKGKEILQELAKLTTVSKHELNSCIDFHEAPFRTIGFATNDDYFGFVVDDSWECKIPQDCKEILSSEYKALFKQ